MSITLEEKNYIAAITLPSNSTYYLKDADLTERVAALQSYTAYLGVTSTAIQDGDSTNPITINSQSVTAVVGNIVNYGSKEFIFNGTIWQEFGDMSGLGALAYKSSASGSFTPQGSVSQPTFSGGTDTVTFSITTSDSGNYTPAGSVAAPTISVSSAGGTTTIKNPTKETVAKTMITAAPGATAPTNSLIYYSVSSQVLSLYQIGYTTGDSISTSDVSVKTGDASYTATAPAFTGTKVLISGSVTPTGTITQPSFSGTAATITVS